jgi:tRNA 2-selenouridine synthase
MAVTKVHIEQFLGMASSFPVLDVRSPGEYAHAHIPAAISLPLFNDEERKVVGTAYKQRSREDAIKFGLDYFGPKMRLMVEQVEQIAEAHNKRTKANSKTILVHCWRGGMRSGAVAWLLDLYGFEVYTLVGGYKSFRRWGHAQFEKQYPFRMIGGYTGSGKTEVLKHLELKKERIIDLEAIAGHRGSAFGELGGPGQPSQEMFENILALRLHAVGTDLNDRDTIWLEDESQRIGLINLPNAFWDSMRKAHLYFLEVGFEPRLDHIVAGYGKFDKEKLLNAIVRIQKRLGPLETKTAVNHLLEDNVKECFRILLHYYDKYYTRSLKNRDNLSTILNNIPCDTIDAKENANKLLAFEKPA